MALQLLKRNYTMQGYEAPRILKLPQGEVRWAPRRLPVDVGDVMMNVRMNDDKNRYIGEHVSKYAQGTNPYGEWGYPYKINKNNIRPPIIDPKFYEPLSRMPVKFDAVTAGPIVKNLYEKRIEIAKVAPQTIIDRVCPDACPTIAMRGDNYTDNSYHEGEISLHLKQPHASIPYHPSIPVHLNTGVPDIELDPKIMIRPQAGIHAPFTHSDQTRDINNMRTPMHVAVSPGYKDPYTTVLPTIEDIQGINEGRYNVSATSGFDPGYTLEPEINTDIPLASSLQTAAQTNIVAPVPNVSNLTRVGPELVPKVQTSAWYNPSFETNLGYSIGNVDDNICETRVKTSARAIPTMHLLDLTEHQFDGGFEPMIKNAVIHTAATAPVHYRMIENNGSDVPIVTRQALNVAGKTNVSSRLLQEGDLGDVYLPDAIHAGEFSGKATVPTIDSHQDYNRTRTTSGHEYFFVENRVNDKLQTNETPTGIRSRLKVGGPDIERRGLEPPERVIPVGTGRFVHSPF